MVSNEKNTSAETVGSAEKSNFIVRSLDVIAKEDIDSVSKLIEYGYITTDRSSLLKQSIDYKGLIEEGNNPLVKKILLYSNELDRRDLIGYASILTNEADISWLDVSDIKSISAVDTVATIGGIVIESSSRGYASAYKLISATGLELEKINQETQLQGKKFGVLCDCAPENETLPRLAEHIIQSSLGSGKLDRVGYQTTLLVDKSTINEAIATANYSAASYEILSGSLSTKFLTERSIDSEDILHVKLKNLLDSNTINSLIENTGKNYDTRYLAIQLPFSENLIETSQIYGINFREDQAVFVGTKSI